ncbi:MAG: adenylate/guanylate cyclase domain-containing protein [Verrucomicrobiota bacterium]
MPNRKDTEQHRKTNAILFMDIQGYGKISDDAQLARVASALFDAIAAYSKEVEGLKDLNSWGDAIFAVSETADALLPFAAKIRDLFAEDNLKKHGLPPNLRCRIALHAGKVVELSHDAIKDRRRSLPPTGYAGQTVNLCARAEPVTPPGEIYVTDAFKSILLGKQEGDFSEVGKLELAKGFGQRTLYAFREKDPANRQFPYPGTTRVDSLEASEWRLGFENFAAELLTQPIRLCWAKNPKSQRLELSITIDRRNVKEVLINNQGKTAAVARFVNERRAEFEARDLEIQHFLANPREAEMVLEPFKDIPPLRWASGGILSVVDWQGREWVPVYFRDVRPFGWNISLGQSQRNFRIDPASNREVYQKGSYDREHDYPIHYIQREFIEETVVVNKPDEEKMLQGPEQLLAAATFFLANQEPADCARQYIDTYRKLRKRYDGLNMRDGELKEPTINRSPVSVTVIGRDGIALGPMSDVRLCFTLLDMGIEVVQVVKYSLLPNEVFMDGEMAVTTSENIDNWNLIRMPMALLSTDYLKRAFGDRKMQFAYSDEPEPSMLVDSPVYSNDLNKTDIHLYQWDLRRRKRAQTLSNREEDAFLADQVRRNRWLRWVGSFYQGEKIRTDRIPDYFVPGAAKLFNQYFSSL